MDNLTHSLLGVTLGRTRLGQAGRGTTAALVLASNAPDIDAITGIVGGGPAYLAWHRGPTHGPLGVVGLSIATAAIVWAALRILDRRRPPSRPNAPFGMLCAAAVIGVLCHILMDLPTSYGTRLLSPFSWRWYAIDWMPIIDVYLLGVLVAGTLFGRVSEASRHRNAAIVLTLVATIYGVRAFAHRDALELAPELFGPALPTWCGPQTVHDAGIVSWPPTVPPTAAAPGKRCLVDMAAVPSFVSPFRWTIVAHLSNAYELHDIDLLDTRLRRSVPATEQFWRLSIRYPNVWTPAVKTAAERPLAQRFLGFSRYPSARIVTDERTGATTVRFVDIRFVNATAVTRAAGRGNLFTATVRLAPDGQAIDEHLGP